MLGCCWSRWSYPIHWPSQVKRDQLIYSTYFSIIPKHCIYLSNRSFWREGHSEEIESTNFPHLFFPVLYSVNNLYFIYTKKISTCILDGSRICYAVYAMISGMHYCLVVEEALDVLESLSAVTLLLSSRNLPKQAIPQTLLQRKLTEFFV